MFHRKVENKLYDYYKNVDDPIIILTGARQIGKSFIIRETAKKIYKNYIEINMQIDFNNDKLFSNINSVTDFYLQVSVFEGHKLGNINDTIIFLDEIQVYPNLISLLKPLKQDNKYRYIASGSLLGITLKHQFIPIGSIQEVKMYPLDFEEFLLASGVGQSVIDYLKQCYKNLEPITDNIHKSIFRKFKDYLICGGLPDAIKDYLNSNIAKTRDTQNQIYSFYKDDASKYDEIHKLKIRMIYDSLPSYMENKVKRIQFKKIENIRNANLIDYEDEFEYLINSGVALGVKAIANPKFPLIESFSKNLIKLYYNDVGILTNILYKEKVDAVLNVKLGINLGSAYETAVAMELIAHGHPLYYFDSKKVGEVDFLINDYDTLSVLPIEVKSGKDTYNFRAIPRLVKEPYNLKRGIILNNKNEIIVKDKLITMPIYMVMFI